MLGSFTIKSAILGAIVGDALGVPYEFKMPYEIKQDEIKEFKGFGTHNVPPGYFSDDGSMILATLDGLNMDNQIVYYHKIAKNFCKWLYNGEFTADGKIFDVGDTTRRAISLLDMDKLGGQSGEMDCGNGSLMRMIPLALYLYDNQDKFDTFHVVDIVSSLTHSHPKCVIACWMYVEYAMALLRGETKLQAYNTMQSKVLDRMTFSVSSLDGFRRILWDDIAFQCKEDIKPSGYVIDSLEATLWCFMNSQSYDESVIKTISLGGDTDTIACLVGGLSGIYYGYGSINQDWLNKIARKDDIINLCNEYARR